MKFSIIGTVGVPACYGGFETLVEQLALYSRKHGGLADELVIYCSSTAYDEQPETFAGARLRYSRFNANGVQSVLYDISTALDARVKGSNLLLFLGVSGAIAFPFLKLVPRTKIVTNVDGIEWKREKWKGLAKWFLKFSEAVAVRFSDVIIADNNGIRDYLEESYGKSAQVIAYGGDNAAVGTKVFEATVGLPAHFALALCRIEPENNVKMILDAFAASTTDLVFVGNWQNSEYGRSLYEQYSQIAGLHLLDPIYQKDALHHIRSHAAYYVHGHSAGGTNPSLVEMMHYGIPIFAFDCNYNRYTTHDLGVFFSSSQQLESLFSAGQSADVGLRIKRVAEDNYTWEKIGKQYFDCLKGADLS